MNNPEPEIKGCNISDAEFLKFPHESQWGTIARCLRVAGLPVRESLIYEQAGMGVLADEHKKQLLNEALAVVNATKLQIWEDKNRGITTAIWQ